MHYAGWSVDQNDDRISGSVRIKSPQMAVSSPSCEGQHVRLAQENGSDGKPWR